MPVSYSFVVICYNIYML